MKTALHRMPSSNELHNQSGVALIIVLGFLGLMVMMAVAFMVQARVERMVADSSLEAMRARQVAQTGIAAAIQDYVNATLSWGQTDSRLDLFLSGDFQDVAHYTGEGYDYSDIIYGSTNLWYGEARDWLPANLTDSDNKDVRLDDIKDMMWIWVRKTPGDRTRILGRYAYACFKLSGGVDANLLGLDTKEDGGENTYGCATNRNNVRKMAFNSILAKGASQSALSEYQGGKRSGWQGFDTPAALNLLTDGYVNDGDDNNTENRWGGQIDEKRVGPIPTDNLTCYTCASTYLGKKLKLSEESIESVMDSTNLTSLIHHMLGQSFVAGEGETQMRGNIRQAIMDYISTAEYPQGVNYPSVKDVPMFNEIKAETYLLHDDGKWQFRVVLQPEFWCPFPSKDNDSDTTYYLKSPNIGIGSAQKGPEDVDLWVRVLVATEGGSAPVSPTFQLVSTSPSELKVKKSSSPETFGAITNTFDIVDLPENADGSIQNISALRVAAIIFQNRWPLVFRDGSDHAVDSTPEENFSIPFVATLKPGSEGNHAEKYMEVMDPRLNHKANLWVSSSGSLGARNSCLDRAIEDATAAMGYPPGEYMYCRRGPMQTPAELGYIPFYSPDAPKANHPWLTLDIFSDAGVALINDLVCDTNLWKKINEKEHNYSYFTNGTINPYTHSTNVLCSAFYGVDYREVPNMSGNPTRFGKQNDGSQMLGDIARLITNSYIQSSAHSTTPFIKKGPAGWARVLDTNIVNKAWTKFEKNLNKNERVSLVHNTWGLFNESDNLFLVFVVAQSITEAPSQVDPVGTWNEKEDMVTGERWAVALCWMDTSADAEENENIDDQTREMDIIMFKYLNE